MIQSDHEIRERIATYGIAKENKVDEKSDEISNIANNSHIYQDAQAICESYNAILATYDEVEYVTSHCRIVIERHLSIQS